MMRSGRVCLFSRRCCMPIGNIGQFVFLEVEVSSLPHNRCFARHHDPMFGALVMVLQRKRGAGVDLDQLDLGCRRQCAEFRRNPRGDRRAHAARLPAARRLDQSVHDTLDVLVAVPRGDQDGVGGDDDDEILDTECRNQAILAADEIAAGRPRRSHRRSRHCRSASLMPRSHSIDQEPTSLQPISAGTTAALSVRSITA